MNILDQLKRVSRVVADTGDFESMKEFKPIDATTNPSLIYAAAQQPEYSDLIEEAIAYSKNGADTAHQQLETCLDRIAVNFGKEIVKIVEGRVSTEADARLSFDSNLTIEKARKLILMYETEGISRDKILIKIASTWEGIKAAEMLEKEGIHCNLTLLFGMAQAIACAEAHVTLISPFVGRILDWHKKARGVDSIPAPEDPGVLSVKRIYNYYKAFDYPTEIMAASFRNTGEILELAGCDLLTIAPKLLRELESMHGELDAKLGKKRASANDEIKISINEQRFRWMLNEDAMAAEKLSEGIRTFSEDLVKLETFIKEKYF